jgi:hypothetical protein
MILTILGIILKVTGISLLLFWLLFTQWSVRKAKGWEENISMQRAFFVIAFLGVFGIYTQWIMFFFAYPFRNNKFRPFSWWLDDSRLGNYLGSKWAKDYYIHLNGRKETFWVAYLWHMRNMIWNLASKFRVKPQTITEGNQNIVITRMITDTIRKIDGTKLDVDGIYGQFAGLKYWKDGVSTWQTMNGEQISIEKSIIGTGFYFHINGDQPEEDNQLNWTFTSCKKVKTWFFGYRWITIQLGMKQRGYSRQFKYQKDQPLK